MNIHPQQTKQGNILIVDDSLEEAQVLCGILGKHGYTVRGIISGLQVLAVAQFAPPDLILLDVKMLSIHGYDVCQQLKANEVTHHIPIIILGCIHDVLGSLTNLEAVCVDLILKPFKVEDVLAKVENQLATQENLRQKA
ncbi:MAG: response regulator [Scytonematopsis contorta HA4267-MV1]|jgi:two-component system sensor histidine kinase/response regulator|nr:response regulator [Scytonematopsis contorta HA4267-MV1]